MKIQLELISDVEPQVDYLPAAGASPPRFRFRFGAFEIECHPTNAKFILDRLAGEYVKMEAMHDDG